MEEALSGVDSLAISADASQCTNELKRRHDGILHVVTDVLHNKGATFTANRFRGNLISHSFRDLHIQRPEKAGC